MPGACSHCSPACPSPRRSSPAEMNRSAGHAPGTSPTTCVNVTCAVTCTPVRPRPLRSGRAAAGLLHDRTGRRTWSEPSSAARAGVERPDPPCRLRALASDALADRAGRRALRPAGAGPVRYLQPRDGAAAPRTQRPHSLGDPPDDPRVLPFEPPIGGSAPPLPHGRGAGARPSRRPVGQHPGPRPARQRPHRVRSRPADRGGSPGSEQGAPLRRGPRAPERAQPVPARRGVIDPRLRAGSARASLLARMANEAKRAGVVPRRIHLVMAIDREHPRSRPGASRLVRGAIPVPLG